MKPSGRTVRIDGIDEVKAKLLEAQQRVSGACSTILQVLGERLSKLTAPLAPIKFGWLRASLSRGDPDNIWELTPFQLVFGTHVKYAAAQEFNDWYNHPEGGQAHYLSTGLAMLESEIIGIATDIVEEALKG